MSSPLNLMLALVVVSLSLGRVLPTVAQELLNDGGFEASTPNGTFPDSGFWQQSFAPGGAGALCITTTAHSGNNVLHEFTGEAGTAAWAAPFQEVPSSAGKFLHASAWLRTPATFPFQPGSQAYIRVDFVNAGGGTLSSVQSSALTAVNTDWSQFQVTTAAAPAGTAKARFICYLSKPDGAMGVSVVQFDDCSLVETNVVEPSNSLTNASFEQTFDLPAGPFPTNWYGAWKGDGGAVAVPPALSGSKGLYQYTDTVDSNYWTSIYQDVAIPPGAAFRASAWVRTPVPTMWIPGSEAYFKVFFLTISNNIVLESYKSGRFTSPNNDWSRLELTTWAAPPGAVFARFALYVFKPDGSNGQSVVSFDDCSLNPISVARPRVSSQALGLTASQTSVTFELRNIGTAPLPWQLTENIPWLSAAVTSGMVAPVAAANITLNASRAGLSGTTAIKGSFTLQAGTNLFPIDVYLDMPAPPPPALPSEVRIYGRQLRVRDRLPDGSLSAPYHYIVKGPAWAPASIGTSGGSVARRAEFPKWYIADIQLLRAMNANTVYTFLDFGLDATATAILDNLYKNGLKAIVTVDDDGSADTNRLQQVVAAYKNHPAILAWAIGNEWNINLYHEVFTNILDAAEATEALAQRAKAIDPNHPVVAIYGDIDIPGLNPLRISDEGTNQPVSTERIVNLICPSVDFWGLNIYRGPSFRDLFEQWRSITTRPMFFSEYGTDAYFIDFLDLLDGVEDEPSQAEFNRGLWNEIVTNLSALNVTNICFGGTFFEWCDEWWKARPKDGASIDVQENLGYGGGHPDGFANEEWFAVMGVDRRLRQSYFNYQADFAATVAPPDLDQDGLPDVWEYQLIDLNGADAIGHLTQLKPGDDFDGDQANNLNEYLADTDAANSQSRLRVTSLIRNGPNVRLKWTGGIQATQYVERRVALTSGVPWLTIFTNPPPTSVTNEHIDPNGGNSSSQFYRIRAKR